MEYITTEDLLTVIFQEQLDELLNGGDVDLDLIEENSIGEMAGYLNIRYDVTKCFDPMAKIGIIKMRLVDIVLYHAHAAIMPDNIPTLRGERYKAAIQWLDKVAGGFIAPLLPIKEVDPITPLRYGNSTVKSEKHF